MKWQAFLIWLMARCQDALTPSLRSGECVNVVSRHRKASMQLLSIWAKQKELCNRYDHIFWKISLPTLCVTYSMWFLLRQ